MERETKIFKTPKGKELKIKTYMTARERNTIKNSFLSEVKLDLSKLKPGQENLSELADKVSASEIGEKNEAALIEQMIVSYDGKTEQKDILNTLLDGSPDEYDFVLKSINDLLKDFQTAK